MSQKSGTNVARSRSVSTSVSFSLLCSTQLLCWSEPSLFQKYVCVTPFTSTAMERTIDTASIVNAVFDTVSDLGINACPPLIVGVMASLEGARAGAIFAIAYGALCDLTTAGAFPCVYTLAFTLAALLCAALAGSVLQQGVLCSLAASALTFLVLDALQMLALAHRAAFGAMLSLTARETLVSCPMLAVVHPVLYRLHRWFTL